MAEWNNLDVAQVLHEIADLLEVQEADPFKIRAYRRAAHAMESTLEEVMLLASQGRLTSLPGVGKAISQKVHELITTGRMAYLEELRRAFPPGVLALTRVPGLGARTAQTLYIRCGIDSPDRLEQAVRQGELRRLPGFGPKKEAAILEALARMHRRTEQPPLGAVWPLAEALADRLCRHPAVISASLADSLPNGQGSTAGIDIVVVSHAPAEVLAFIRQLPIAAEVLEETATTARVMTSFGRQVRVAVLPPDIYGSVNSGPESFA